MAKRQYHIKVADLQESPAKTTAAKEMLIVRAIRTRRGTAGRAQKWECDLIDDARAESVLLADAWGGKYGPRRKEIEERYSIQDHEVCCPQQREIHSVWK